MQMKHINFSQGRFCTWKFWKWELLELGHGLFSFGFQCGQKLFWISYFYFSDRFREKTYQNVLTFFFSFKEPILFSSSIADNIAYGAATGQQVSQDDIEDAAVQANAYSFIKSFPKGFDTVVGERGQMLSGYNHRIGLNSPQATTSKWLNQSVMPLH